MEANNINKFNRPISAMNEGQFLTYLNQNACSDEEWGGGCLC